MTLLIKKKICSDNDFSFFFRTSNFALIKKQTQISCLKNANLYHDLDFT